MSGHDIQQLAGEDGVDRLAVAVGEALQPEAVPRLEPHPG